MVKRKSTPPVAPVAGKSPAQTKTSARLRIEPTKPRNPIALNPLLGKSTPHQDKRKLAQLNRAKSAIRNAAKDKD
jgi:hypothetical protein